MLRAQVDTRGNVSNWIDDVLRKASDDDFASGLHRQRQRFWDLCDYYVDSGLDRAEALALALDSWLKVSNTENLLSVWADQWAGDNDVEVS